MTSILPGTLVQSLITAVVPSGLNLQILGFFEGTIDLVHLHPGKTHKIGQKVKARVLYDISGTTPPKFALALADHIVSLDVRRAKGAPNSNIRPILQEAYPVGTILNEVKVTNVEPERGLILEVEPGVEGFVHVSWFLHLHFGIIFTTFRRSHMYLTIMYPPSHHHLEHGRWILFTKPASPTTFFSTASCNSHCDHQSSSKVICKSVTFRLAS